MQEFDGHDGLDGIPKAWKAMKYNLKNIWLEFSILEDQKQKNFLFNIKPKKVIIDEALWQMNENEHHGKM